METDKPKAKGDLNCPLYRKPMKQVCHKCALFIRIIGKNPQSMEQFDSWDCALALMPILSIENAQMTRQAGAAIESLRNEIVKAEQVKLSIAAPALMEATKMLEKVHARDDHEN